MFAQVIIITEKYPALHHMKESHLVQLLVCMRYRVLSLREITPFTYMVIHNQFL